MIILIFTQTFYSVESIIIRWKWVLTTGFYCTVQMLNSSPRSQGFDCGSASCDYKTLHHGKLPVLPVCTSCVCTLALNSCSGLLMWRNMWWYWVIISYILSYTAVVTLLCLRLIGRHFEHGKRRSPSFPSAPRVVLFAYAKAAGKKIKGGKTEERGDCVEIKAEEMQFKDTK